MKTTLAARVWQHLATTIVRFGAEPCTKTIFNQIHNVLIQSTLGNYNNLSAVIRIPSLAPSLPAVCMYRTKKELAALLLEEDWNMQIAKAIYALREKSGLSHKDLAERAGLPLSTVSRLEDADLRWVS